MSDLPPGWEWATFDDVAQVASNLVDPADFLDAPHIAPNHIESGTGRLLEFATVRADSVKSAKHRFFKGQILYSKIRPYLAKVALANFDGVCSADMYPVNTALHPGYLKWWMLTDAFTESASRQQARSVLPKINAVALRRLRVPVPPAAEQGRIFEHLDELTTSIDAGNTQVALALSRASALTSAVLGDAIPPCCTSSWKHVTVADAGRVDLGRQRHPDWHDGPNMRPYLRVANVFEDRIDLSDVMEMHFTPAEFERFRLVPGDILLNEGQSPQYLGRPAMYMGEPAEVAFTNSLLRFRAGDDVLPEWALLVFRHHMRSGRFMREVRITTNIAHLSAGRFKAVEFPVPPLAEQRRLVAEVGERLTEAARLMDAVRLAQARAASLRRSVLADAFAGRLVRQDPTDEPASVLLERIRAERTAQDATAGRRRGRRKPE